ncbi:MAG: T9SS type A sorting domain-containing protein [Bacteroidia bacterium]
MKKIYFILLACIAFAGAKATTYTVSISGFAYTPNTLTVSIGDMVVFNGPSATHPTAQVDGSTWTANGTTPKTGGWGVMTSNFTFTATAAGTVYYVCQNHVASSNMKGQIVVNSVGINESANLLQNISLFPNPAQENVKVNFSLKGASDVSIKLFNMLGQEVSTLTPNMPLAPGNYNYSFDVPALNNGTYFMEINTNEKRSVRKFVISK